MAGVVYHEKCYPSMMAFVKMEAEDSVKCFADSALRTQTEGKL
jgi:hypothetical protein